MASGCYKIFYSWYQLSYVYYIDQGEWLGRIKSLGTLAVQLSVFNPLKYKNSYNIDIGDIESGVCTFCLKNKTLYNVND